MARQVWLGPNVASRDFLRMFTNPEEWSEALGRVDVMEFIQWSITHAPNPQSGPNTAEAFLGCVPGGAFRWLRDRGIDVALEGSSVKEWSCGDDRHRAVDGMMETLDIIHDSGGVVKYIEMDEPFTAGMLPAPDGCGYSLEQTADEVKVFVDAIHAKYPDIGIGVVEAYPHNSAATVVATVRAMQAAGVGLPFVHLDVDYYRVRREKSPLRRDLPAIMEAARESGCRFGAVVWGETGSSNEAYARDAQNLARAIHKAIGLGDQDNLVFMSWSTEQVNGQGPKTRPDNLPESSPTSHTGLLLQTLKKYGVVAEPKEDH
jgi:hypothetical protein